MQKVVKILFVTLSNIGDCILTLPVLDVLKQNFPQAEITVIVSPRPAQIFQESPNVNKVFVYDKHGRFIDKIKLLACLRKQGFDLIVDLRNSIFSWLVPARRKNPGLSAIPAGIQHMRDRQLFKISGLGLKVQGFKDQNKSLQVRLQDEEYIKLALKDAGITETDRIITVSPGARSLIKRWPKDKFVDLIDNLPDGSKVVLIGDQDDIQLNLYISRNTKSRVLDLTGKTSLLEASALLRMSAMLITNDSANLHLASYLNVPTVAVFGPTDDAKYGPWADKFGVAKKEIFCRPCMKAQCRFGTLDCLRLVRVQDILLQVRDILSPIAKPRGGSAPKQYKRILIVRTDRIGDVILSTPVIKALRDAYPQAYLGMVVRPYTKTIVEGNPYLDEVIIYDRDSQEKNWLATFLFSRALARKKFDLAVVLNPSNRSNFIPFLAGIPRRIGYDRKSGFLLTKRLKDSKYEGRKHEIEYNLDLVRALGVEPLDKSTFIPLSSESESWADKVLKKEGVLPSERLVVINPGASEISKMWPQERFAQVADELAVKGFKIIILGGPGDRKISQEVIDRLHCPYIDMVGNNNISQVASLLKRSSLFISSDTGPMHIASSLGVPVVAIFGRSQPGLSPKRWGPHNENSVVLQKNVGCVECLAHNCRKGFLCIQSTTVEEVVRAAESLIS